jgi:hypothetical protein
VKDKITVSIEAKEVIISANRSGFSHLASICTRLASLTEAELATPANHFHFLAEMNNATSNSVPLVLQITPKE